MTTLYHMSHEEVQKQALRILQDAREHGCTTIYGVPRGGIPVAYLLSGLGGMRITGVPEHADLIVDDIIASGNTRHEHSLKYPRAIFRALCHQTDFPGQWVVFPWEQTVEGSAEDICTRLLSFVGEDPKREGLLETPKRFIKAWQFYTRGYKQDPAAILKTFEDGGENYDEMILLKGIPVWSSCEHHLAPFFGVAHVAYIPDRRIVGLSKLSRLVDCFARRLQVQERLTAQVADALMEHLAPRGAAVMLDCRHTCMESRGIERAGVSTITSALRGVFLTKGEARSEFLGRL